MDWQKLVYTTLEELDRVSESKSCIMATAVLLDVLKARGIRDAYPLTVKYKVLNPKFTERLNSEPFPQTPEEIAKWQNDGCAIVAITNEINSDTHWAGHLIAVIPKSLKGKDAICDLTISQANVPEWNITLGSVVVGVRDSFKDGIEDFGVTMNGCQVIYRAFPGNQTFRQTPLWKQSLKREALVKRILKRLKFSF